MAPQVMLVGLLVTVPTPAPAAETVAAVDELRLAAVVTTRPPTLDDVYLQLTGDPLADAA